MGSGLPLMFSSLFCFSLFFCVLCSLGHSSQLHWVRLTKDNFTSDIHTHPFLLCIATVPWCGESRSIMRELLRSIEVDDNVHSVIQLRVVYVNFDKSLEVFVSGRTRYPTFTFYWHSTPFKYKGKLRVQNILAAIQHAMSFNPRDSPLKNLETTSELDVFMESTDKPVILFDFCNYAEELRKSKGHQVLDKPTDAWPGSRVNNDMEGTKRLVDEASLFESHGNGEQYNTKSVIQRSEDLRPAVLKVEEQMIRSSNGEAVLQEDAQVSLRPITGEDNEMLKLLAKDDTEIGILTSYGASWVKRNLGSENDIQHQVVSCQPETEFLLAKSPSSSFWMKSKNAGQHEQVWSTDSGVLSQVAGCNRTEYKHFAIVYQNLTKIVRTHALTPEHADFAIVRNKSLLSYLGIEEMQNYTWFLMQWMPGRPYLPRLYFRDEMVNSFLMSSKPLVTELSQEMMNHYSTFSNQTASVILFIDRASSLLEVRRKSWEALRALRAFAKDYVGGENVEATSKDSQMKGKPETDVKSNFIKSVIEAQLRTDSLKDFLGLGTVQHSTDQPTRVSDELIGKDRSVHPEAGIHGSNVVMKILVEGEEKLQLESSLSSIISDKFQDLGFSKFLLSGDNAIYEVQEGGIVGKIDNDAISSSVQGFGSRFPTYSESFVGSESAKLIEKDIQPPSSDTVEEKVVKSKNTHMNHENALSFYFVDGEDQWKDRVLSGLPYPSLVILDSSKGGKFLFPQIDQPINYPSLKNFVNQYANDNLQNTYLSESAPQKPRKQCQPPFVNRDFHEVDGVFRVTAEELLQFSSGSQMMESLSTPPFDCTEDMNIFWKRDALVLFTTPSCGFCKRMELVFREVHRLLTLDLGGSSRDSFLKQKTKHPYSTRDTRENQEVGLVEGVSKGDHELEFQEKSPRLLQIDCTSNDCSAFFKSIDQEELYPSIILYPSGNRGPPIIFEGRSTVQDIIKFFAVEGEAGTEILYRLQGGILNERSNSGCLFPPRLSQAIHINATTGTVRHAFHFAADMPSGSSEENDENREGVLKPIVYPTVGSVLLATKQLSEASKVFESSSILIVKADGQEGFQGLIFNKPLPWMRIPGLDSEMALLVNNTFLCYGGPVIVHGQPFLSLSRLKDLEGFSEVVPGVYFGGSLATMHVLQSIKDLKLEAADFWFFLGHAVWGWQQLLNEIALQSWNLTSYEEGTVHLPLQEWLDGLTISVSDVLEKGVTASAS